MNKMIIKGRSLAMRHVSRIHRVALDWLFDRINLDPKIQIKYINTKNQLANILTKGNFTRDKWNHLLNLFNNGHFSSTVSTRCNGKTAQQGAGEESHSQIATHDEFDFEDAEGRVCMNFIHWEKDSWKRLSLIGDETVINLQSTKVYVFSDSVWCLGKILQHPGSNEVWKNRIAGVKAEKSYRDYDGINGEPTHPPRIHNVAALW